VAEERWRSLSKRVLGRWQADRHKRRTVRRGWAVCLGVVSGYGNRLRLQVGWMFRPTRSEASFAGMGVLWLWRCRRRELWRPVSQKGQLRGGGGLGIEARIGVPIGLGGAAAGNGVVHCAGGLGRSNY
jgi:hypothetical protein